MLGERGAAKVTQASNAAGLDLGQSSEKERADRGPKDGVKAWGHDPGLRLSTDQHTHPRT